VRKLFYSNGRWYNGKITAQRDDDTWAGAYTPPLLNLT
jgi:hypothetical protein